jgi:hypothetical protein
MSSNANFKKYVDPEEIYIFLYNKNYFDKAICFSLQKFLCLNLWNFSTALPKQPLGSQVIHC